MRERWTAYMANKGFVTSKVAQAKWCKTGYTTDPQEARVFFREQDARRGGHTPVKVMLWYGPHTPHERDWK